MKKIDKLSNKRKLFSQIAVGQIFYEVVGGKIGKLKMMECVKIEGEPAYAYTDIDTKIVYRSFTNAETRFSASDYFLQERRSKIFEQSPQTTNNINFA